MKRGQTTTASNLPSSVSAVFVGVFSTEFMCFHSFSLTFFLSDHPSPLLRQMSGSRVPERAIRIRIINIISFHCDPRCGPLHTQGREATNIMATESSQLSIYILPPLSSPHTATHTPSAVAKLQFERRQGRSSSGSGCGRAGGCRARGTPYNGACCWPTFRWNWIGNLPWLVSITKGLVALDKGCFSNAQNQSLYGPGPLFPPAIQVFLQWSLIKSVKTKLRVISAPPQLLLQGWKKEGDQTPRTANSWAGVCAGCWAHSDTSMHDAKPARKVPCSCLRLIQMWATSASLPEPTNLVTKRRQRFISNVQNNFPISFVAAFTPKARLVIFGGSYHFPWRLFNNGKPQVHLFK